MGSHDVVQVPPLMSNGTAACSYSCLSSIGSLVTPLVFDPAFSLPVYMEDLPTSRSRQCWACCSSTLSLLPPPNPLPTAVDPTQPRPLSLGPPLLVIDFDGSNFFLFYRVSLALLFLATLLSSFSTDVNSTFLFPPRIRYS